LPVITQAVLPGESASRRRSQHSLDLQLFP
jgi:hypothetical protein